MTVSSSLPLLRRAATGDGAFVLVAPGPRVERAPGGARLASAPQDGMRARMPDRRPGTGEQYRFHFDMGACIGCKCCVVACNEQNGNPADINWRRVGDLQGGFYPAVAHSHLSMSCNHCLEPTCLEGCPVDAYSKDPLTGIVHHSADACIGCQYCTWNCSYGAPQFNPERGVVGKCDMCHGRLSTGASPACVSACPQGAIAIEIVKVADWRAAVEGRRPAAGIPRGDHSLSTTRVSPAASLPPNTRPVDVTHVRPAESHWPLVVMTVLTQLSAGALAAVWMLQLFGGSARLGLAAVVSLSVACLALAASTLHLGRPVHAYRALRMWRRSWLSREVLLFGAFSGVATSYAALLWFGLPGSLAAGGLTAILGAAGVTASAYIYRVPARPAWNTPFTVAQFHLTAGILGPLVAAAFGAGDPGTLGFVVALLSGVQLAVFAIHFFHCAASDSLPLAGTARLLSSVLAPTLLLRAGLLVVAGIALPLLAGGAPAATGPGDFVPFMSRGALIMSVALVLAGAAEILGRYLFFVSVVPQHAAAPYLAAGSEAA